MENFLGLGNFPYEGQLWHLVSIYGDGDGELLTDSNKEVFHKMGCEKLFL